MCTLLIDIDSKTLIAKENLDAMKSNRERLINSHPHATRWNNVTTKEGYTDDEAEILGRILSGEMN